MTCLEHYCENVSEIEIPVLTPQQAERAVERLSAGRKLRCKP